MDVRRHVGIDVFQGRLVGRITTVHAAYLVVLLPEVGLNELGRREKSEDGGVAPRQPAALGECRGSFTEGSEECRSYSGGGSRRQEGQATYAAGRLVICY